METTVKSGNSMPGNSGAPSGRSFVTSLAVHIAVIALLLLIPTKALLPNARPKALEVVFIKARQPVKVPVRAALPPAPRMGSPAGPLPDRGGSPAPAADPKVGKPPGPDAPGSPELAPGPASAAADVPPQQKVGKTGILALRDKFASVSKDRVTPRLGENARYSAADDIGKPSARSGLTSSAPGSSGGINVASLNRSVGGGGGGGGGGGTGAGGTGGGGGGGGGGFARATSAINAVGGDDRPKARAGMGASRTDEEIQIVFDRYKASFYRLYNRELRNNPTLQGQIVLRLTIEPDGSVSMCVLHSSDMNAPDLAAQVVSRTKTINFGEKEGVQAVTIVYPIDFLPAG